MPMITVQLFEDRLTEQTEATLIARLTEAVGEVLGPETAAQTWVVLAGTPRRRWGIGGTPGAVTTPGS